MSDELPPSVRSNVVAQAPAPSLRAGTGTFELTGYALTLRAWQAYSFAPYWYSDAQREAEQAGRDARRREILFAVAVAECGLFEWVRDQVLEHNYNKLETYFDPENPKRIQDKWKDVPKNLLAAGLIAGVPDLSGKTWSDFTDLVAYRNGLVHGGASRPTSAGLRQESLPMPDIGTLDSLPPGWAFGVVRKLLDELVVASGKAAPHWLK